MHLNPLAPIILPFESKKDTRNGTSMNKIKKRYKTTSNDILLEKAYLLTLCRNSAIPCTLGQANRQPLNILISRASVSLFGVQSARKRSDEACRVADQADSLIIASLTLAPRTGTPSLKHSCSRGKWSEMNLIALVSYKFFQYNVKRWNIYWCI